MPATHTAQSASPVPLLDLKAQYATLRDEIRDAIERVMESQHFILGPEVSALEEEVARYVGTKHGIGMSSGTDALLAALMAVDIGPGDEIITTPYSFFATAGVIARLGATPVFVDIDPSDFNIDTTRIEAVITGRTKVIMPVHLFGSVVDMDPIRALAKAQQITVIEDAAQAIGARDEQGRSAGIMSEMACFSFFPSKNLGGVGDGGMTVTADDELAERLRMLRAHGSKPKYYHKIVGGNFRLDALQAAVLRVKLPHLDKWTEARRRNAERYRTLFSERNLNASATLPSDTPGHIYNQFVIRAPRRDELQRFLAAAQVGTEVYYPVPLHMQECFAYIGHKEGDFPHSEAAARETLALPIYPELNDAQLTHIVDTIAKFYEKN